MSNAKESKKPDNSLHLSKEHLALALEAGKMATWHVNLTTGELTGSQSLLDLHGITKFPKDLAAAINETVHPDHQTELDEILKNCISKRIPFEHQYKIVRPNGDVRWLEGHGKTSYDESGKPLSIIGIVSDITDRKLQAIEIEHSRQDLKSYFMQAPIPMVMLSGPDHLFVIANAPYEQFVGRKVIGKTVLEAFTTAEVGEFIPLLDGVYRTGVPFIGKEHLVRISDENGVTQERWLNIGYHPFRNEFGAITGVLAILEEVTEQVIARKKVEIIAQELATERNKLETIFNDSPAGMALWRGRDFIFERVNPEYQSWFVGRQLLDLPIGDALPELRGQAFPELLLKVFETGETVVAHEMFAQIVRFQGGPLEDRYFDFIYSRVNDSDGKPYGVYAHATDSTERVLNRHKLEKSETQLLRSKDELEATAAISKIGFCELDLINDKTIFSEQMRIDWSIESGGNLEDLLSRIHIDDREQVRNALNGAVKNRTVCNEKFRVVCPNGSVIWVEAQGKATYDLDGRPLRFFGTSRDMSDQKKLLQQVEEAKSSADRANRAKSAFLANMSHEIRTPLGAITGFVGLLKDTTLSRETVSSYVQIIDRNSHHLMRIVDDVLDLAKVESGKIDFEKVEFSFADLVADFSSFMKLKAHENGIEFKYSCVGLVPSAIISDSTRIRQILTNMVGNAIKFTQNGGVELIARYENSTFTFQVRDTGRGISKAQRKNLFRAFAQADSSTTRKYGGSGLGLFLTKRLTQAMGGDFKLLESELGKGSNFEAKIVVEVPTGARMLSPNDMNTVQKTKTDNELKSVNFKHLDILLVEDSPDNQFLVRQLLKQSHASITVANDGVEGVSAASEHTYDVILMDIQMPKMDGHEAVSILRARGYLGPIVALTAHAMKEEKLRAIESGFSHFLTKPIIRADLIELLRQIDENKISALSGTKAPYEAQPGLLH